MTVKLIIPLQRKNERLILNLLLDRYKMYVVVHE